MLIKIIKLHKYMVDLYNHKKNNKELNNNQN